MFHSKNEERLRKKLNSGFLEQHPWSVKKTKNKKTSMLFRSLYGEYKLRLSSILQFLEKVIFTVCNHIGSKEKKLHVGRYQKTFFTDLMFLS